MSPAGNGAAEEAGKVAGDVVHGLKQSPVLLTLVVLNVLGLMVAGWFLHDVVGKAHERQMATFAALKECWQAQGRGNHATGDDH